MKNIHVIKTDKPSRLFIDIDDNKLKICVPLGGEHMMNQNIYITSDEKIKEGDYWIYISPPEWKDTDRIEVVRNVLPNSWFCKLHDKENYKKIILTTDTELIKDGVQAIDDEFLEWFVKNPSCEWVENERLENGQYVDRFADGSVVEGIYENYKIITPSKEDMNPFEIPNVLPDDVFNKSLEELAEKEYPKLIIENPSCNGYNEPKHIDINEECRNAFMEGVKSDKAKDYWFDIFKKNKEKMYSEEDMREAIIFGLNGMYGYQWGKEGQTENQINKYLQELKKK